MLLDVGDRVPDRVHLFRILVGNVHAEFLFEGHHQLDRVQGVRTQILYERRFMRDLLIEILYYPILQI